MEAKVCIKCNTEKLICEFRKSGKYIRGECKECERLSVKKWALENPDRVSQRRYEWGLKNPEKVLAWKNKLLAKDPDYFRRKAKEWSNDNPEIARAKIKKWRAENSFHIGHYRRAWVEKNIDSVVEYRKEYAKKNKEHNKKRWKSWTERNMPKKLALNANRLARKRMAIPSWFGELDYLVEIEAYDLARSRTSLTGIKWSVDHQVPIQSKYVCGLHCANNLAVIEHIENIRKNNRFWPNQ